VNTIFVRFTWPALVWEAHAQLAQATTKTRDGAQLGPRTFSPHNASKQECVVKPIKRAPSPKRSAFRPAARAGASELYYASDKNGLDVCSLSTLAIWNDDAAEMGLPPTEGPRSTWVISVRTTLADGTQAMALDSVHPDRAAAFAEASRRLGAIRFISEEEFQGFLEQSVRESPR
jgi:hypothetical protein